MYKLLYNRESIATRVVQILPHESWKTTPEVIEDEDVENTTKFEEAWSQLNKDLRGTSWLRDEESSPIWEHLRRADVLSGIGHFGVLLLGIDDGQELRQPVEGIKSDGSSDGTKRNRKLLFLRAFDEELVDITQYEKDPLNRRFGLPVMYSITLNDPNEQHSGIGIPLATVNVHWTRVIHLADNLDSSEIFGVPRMRPVFNRLYDLRKTYGGSAEMYWRGAFPGLSFETHPQLGGDVELDQTSVREAAENYMNTLQRYLLTKGMSVKSLAPQVSDPSKQIDVYITAICIVLAVPKRIFMGSERGELSSGQDSTSWNARLMGRQKGYITPRIISPFIDRLIAIGVLPTPESYSVVWPNLDTLTAAEEAEVAIKRTEALAKYIAGNVDSLVAPMDFLTRIVGLPNNEARAVLESAMERIVEEDSGGSPLLELVGGITGMNEMLRLFAEGGMERETLKQLIMLFYQLSPERADQIIADTEAGKTVDISGTPFTSEEDEVENEEDN